VPWHAISETASKATYEAHLWQCPSAELAASTSNCCCFKYFPHAVPDRPSYRHEDGDDCPLGSERSTRFSLRNQGQARIGCNERHVYMGLNEPGRMGARPTTRQNARRQAAVVDRVGFT